MDLEKEIHRLVELINEEVSDAERQGYHTVTFTREEVEQLSRVLVSANRLLAEHQAESHLTVHNASS